MNLQATVPTCYYICKYCKHPFKEAQLLLHHKKVSHLAEVIRDKKKRNASSSVNPTIVPVQADLQESNDQPVNLSAPKPVIVDRPKSNPSPTVIFGKTVVPAVGFHNVITSNNRNVGAEGCQSYSQDPLAVELYKNAQPNNDSLALEVFQRPQDPLPVQPYDRSGDAIAAVDYSKKAITDAPSTDFTKVGKDVTAEFPQLPKDVTAFSYRGGPVGSENIVNKSTVSHVSVICSTTSVSSSAVDDKQSKSVSELSITCVEQSQVSSQHAPTPFIRSEIIKTPGPASALLQIMAGNLPEACFTKPIIQKCNHCSMTFTTELELKLHLNTHVDQMISAVQYRPQILPDQVEKIIQEKGLGDGGNGEKEIEQQQQQNQDTVTKSTGPTKKVPSSKNARHRKRRRAMFSMQTFKCKPCKLTYSSKSALHLHRKRKHLLAPPNVPCQQCPKMFHTLYELQSHEKVHRKDLDRQVPKINCPHCSETFPSTNTMLVHLHSFHPNIGSQSENMDSFNLSENTEASCSSGLFAISDLQTSHQLDPYSFNDQDKDNSLLGDIPGNEQNQTETGRRYACPYCTKSFTQSHVLKEHLRVHTGERPFACEICQKTFRQKSSFRTHMAVHAKYNHSKILHPQPTKNNKSDSNNKVTSSSTVGPRVSKSSLVRNVGSNYGFTPLSPGISQVVHDGIVQYICQTCRDSFDYRIEANEHVLVHAAENM